MTINRLVKRYGTRGISLVLRSVTTHPLAAQMADELEAALEEWAADNVEPPTVDNEVV